MVTETLSVADVLAPNPSLFRMLGRALVLRCPRCGSGGLFHHWFHRSDHCPGCGYAMEVRSDFFFGAYMLNLLFTLFALFAVLIFAVICEAAQLDPPVVPIVAVGLACATVLPFVCYPFSFTIWEVIELQSEPLALQEIADALDTLDADRAAADTESAEHSPC